MVEENEVAAVGSWWISHGPSSVLGVLCSCIHRHHQRSGAHQERGGRAIQAARQPETKGGCGVLHLGSGHLPSCFFDEHIPIQQAFNDTKPSVSQAVSFLNSSTLPFAPQQVEQQYNRDVAAVHGGGGGDMEMDNEYNSFLKELGGDAPP